MSTIKKEKIKSLSYSSMCTCVIENESKMRVIRLLNCVYVYQSVCILQHAFLPIVPQGSLLFSRTQGSIIITILLQFPQQFSSWCVINRGFFFSLYLLLTFCVCIRVRSCLLVWLYLVIVSGLGNMDWKLAAVWCVQFHPKAVAVNKYVFHLFE